MTEDQVKDIVVKMIQSKELQIDIITENCNAFGSKWTEKKLRITHNSDGYSKVILRKNISRQQI